MTDGQLGLLGSWQAEWRVVVWVRLRVDGVRRGQEDNVYIVGIEISRIGFTSQVDGDAVHDGCGHRQREYGWFRVGRPSEEGRGQS